MKDVAAHHAKVALNVQRRLDLTAKDRRLEIRRVAIDGVDDVIGNLFPNGVPRGSSRQVALEVLAEQTGHMAAFRHQRPILGGGQP